MAVQPVVARRLRFLQQPQLRQTRQPRGFHRQRPTGFIKRSRHGQHRFLTLQRLTGKALVPSASDMGEIAGAGGDRRNLGDVIRRAPRQNRRGAIHPRVRQPAFGAGHQASRHARSTLARQFAQHCIRDIAGIGTRPRQSRIGRRQFASRRVVAHRRQQRPSRHRAGRDQLLDGELMDFRRSGGFQLSIGHHRVGGAKVDPDQIIGSLLSGDGSVLPPRIPHHQQF